MTLEIVEKSVLKVCKMQIAIGLADHYFLSEHNNFNNSLGWGAKGLEIRGEIKVTQKEVERIEIFTTATKYNISLHNCEHFANYVLYGLNLCSQKNLWWKDLGANVISCLQPTQSFRENYQKFIRLQIADVLRRNLRQAKIDRANQEHKEFWESRGIKFTEID